jgi:hypothetical protein
MRKPRVITKCVANYYTRPNERIIEVSGENGNGCLISLTTRDDGTIAILVYRAEGVAMEASQYKPVFKTGRWAREVAK